MTIEYRVKQPVYLAVQIDHLDIPSIDIPIPKKPAWEHSSAPPQTSIQRLIPQVVEGPVWILFADMNVAHS